MCSPHFLSDHDTIAVINPVNLEDILCKIDPDSQPGHPVSFPMFDWFLPRYSAVEMGVSTSSRKQAQLGQTQAPVRRLGGALPSSALLRPGSTSHGLVPGRVQSKSAPVSKIAIDAALDARPQNTRKTTMSTIGSFAYNETNDTFKGHIVILKGTFNAMLVPNEKRNSESAPAL